MNVAERSGSGGRSFLDYIFRRVERENVSCSSSALGIVNRRGAVVEEVVVGVLLVVQVDKAVLLGVRDRGRISLSEHRDCKDPCKTLLMGFLLHRELFN